MKPLPDGQAQRLTTGGHCANPRWSPSGQWVAYVKDDELWLVRASGTDARALNPGAKVNTFMWSPAADMLAYTTRTGSLCVVSASDWRERELIAGASDQQGFGVLSMAWSPTGEWLAYVRDEIIKEGQPPDRYAGLWRMRADGSGAEEIFNTGTPARDGLIVAGWSLNSRHILVWPVSLFSLSVLADGTSLNAVPIGDTPKELVQDMLSHADFLAWSPDGKLLAVTEGGGRDTWSHKRIAVVEPTSGTLTYLTDEKTAVLSPVWSPDGQRIAYVAAPDIGFVGGGEVAKAGAAQRRIWVTKRDGSGKRQLTHDAAYRDERPLWSAADGSHILFARLDQKGRAGLWLMRDDGRKLRQVADLSPAPEWFGYYGYINWDGYFAWWTGTLRRP